MKNVCTREDVIEVARSLNFFPTESEIQEVIERFDEDAQSDPTGNWELWIENLLYCMEVKQVVPPKVERPTTEATQSQQDLIDECLERIKEDVEAGDLTAIEELLFFVPIKYLKGFLPEKL
jgi:hypothetical protein